ncbi:MAG: amino acid racemase, partial [Microgenomates group bacterium]
MNKNKKIGVIGGMGPQASAKFYELLIKKSIDRYGVAKNEDCPNIFMHSVPVPDFILNPDYLPISRSILIESVKTLNMAGVSSICIACNTAHLLIPDLRKNSSVPVVSIIEEVAKFIEEKQYKRVGLLSSSMTKTTGLYDRINNQNVRLFTLPKADQKTVSSIIFVVIAGKSGKTEVGLLKTIAQKFVSKQKLDALILG